MPAITAARPSRRRKTCTAWRKPTRHLRTIGGRKALLAVSSWLLAKRSGGLARSQKLEAEFNEYGYQHRRRTRVSQGREEKSCVQNSPPRTVQEHRLQGTNRCRQDNAE